MKKIILIIFIIFLTFLIYKFNDKNLIDYVSIGDSFDLGINSYGNNTYSYHDYIKTYLNDNNLLNTSNFYFSKLNYKTEELLTDLKNNKTILANDKNYNIRKELREADLITISIGLDELMSNIEYNNNLLNKETLYEKTDIMIKNMNEIIYNITKLSKGKIILIGYYNPYNNYNKDLNDFFAYISDQYLTIAKKYKIEYLDIYNLIKQDKNYLPNKKDYHLTSKAYLKVASKIIEIIESNL